MRCVLLRECHQEFARHKPVRSLGLLLSLRQEHQLLLRRLGQRYRRVHRCRREETAARFLARNLAVIVLAVHALDSRCVRNRGKLAGRLRHGPAEGKVVPEARVDLEDRAVLGLKEPEPVQRHLVRALVHARPAAQECCRRSRRNYRPRRSQVSRFIRVGRRNGNGR